ncbi:hypothetical protein Tco_1214917 [Tanacetum coccineum]
MDYQLEHYIRYVVPTDRVIVRTGRYVVPAGKVIIIVSPGSENDSDDASVHSESTIPQQKRNIQPQIITTVSNNNAKFPYLKKDKYEVWAIKMEYWITNNDMNIWKVIQNGNSLKRTGRDCDRRVIILPPMTADEHVAVQRDIWNAVKARFGGNAESKKMRKSRLKQEFSEFRICDTKDAIEEGAAKIYKLITGADTKEVSTAGDAREFALMGVTSEFEIDIQRISTHSSSQSPSHSAFVSTTSTSKKMSYTESPSFSSSTTYSAPSSSKARSHSFEGTAEVYSLITGNGTDTAAGEFALMGMTSKLGYEEKIRVLSIELENTTNLLKHSERINVEAEIAKKDLQTKLDNHLAKTEKTKVGLGFDKYIGESELGWDDSEFSIFTPKSEEVEDTTDLDETQMTYGKKSTCSIDSISVSNDFVSCDNSDKSSEIKSNDYAFCVSSVKSSEPMTADSSSNASTSSVSTHASEANLKSNIGTPIQEPIIVNLHTDAGYEGMVELKNDEGYLVGYSASNRAYRVYNMANKRVEEIMNLRFLEEKANIQGIGHEWSFDLNYLTDSLGYNRDKANQSAGTQDVSSNPAGAEPKDTSDAYSNGVLVPIFLLMFGTDI